MQFLSAARRITCFALAAMSLGGCSSWVTSTESMLGWVSPYRIDVQQGNVVTGEQLAALKVGMNRFQVRDVLGSPLLNDTFHPNRWDYIFTLDRPGRLPQRRDVVLTFDGDKLVKIDAPELPTEREFVASVARTGLPALSMSLALSEEQIKALPVPAKLPPPVPVAPPTSTTRLFPPLEPS